MHHTIKICVLSYFCFVLHTIPFFFVCVSSSSCALCVCVYVCVCVCVCARACRCVSVAKWSMVAKTHVARVRDIEFV